MRKGLPPTHADSLASGPKGKGNTNAIAHKRKAQMKLGYGSEYGVTRKWQWRWMCQRDRQTDIQTGRTDINVSESSMQLVLLLIKSQILGVCVWGNLFQSRLLFWLCNAICKLNFWVFKNYIDVYLKCTWMQVIELGKRYFIYDSDKVQWIIIHEIDE